MKSVKWLGSIALLVFMFNGLIWGDEPAKVKQDAQKAYNDGVSFYKKKQYKKAMEKYLESISLFKSIEDKKDELNLIPDYSNVYTSLGFVYYKMKKYDKAVEAFDSAVKLNPKDKKAYYGQGLAYKKMAKKDKSAIQKGIASFLNAIKLDDNMWKAHFFLGKLYIKAKEYDKAAASFNYVIDLKPTSSPSYKELGKLYEKMKRYKEAVDIYERYLKIKSKDVKIILSIGVIYEEKIRNKKAAIKYYKRVVELTTNSKYKYAAYMKMANIYDGWGKTKLAIKAAKGALTSNSGDPSATYMLGTLYLKLENYEKAKSYFLKVKGDSDLGANAKEQLDYIKKKKGI